MNQSISRVLIAGLLLAAGIQAGTSSTSPQLRIPRGLYAVVPVEDAAGGLFPPGSPIPPPAVWNASFITFYTGLLNNPAVSGLALQVHWDTVNPNPPPDPNPYFWDYVDDAFSSVHQWNSAHPAAGAKTIQLIVSPGYNAPQWELNGLGSCDWLFDHSKAHPAGNCGKATFSNTTEHADGTVLPLPWDPTYKSDWKTFLKALAAKYGADSSLVSIAVAGPTASSVEMILPNGDDLDQWGGFFSNNEVWTQLLKNAGKPAYTDSAFIDEWKAAIDAYAEIFSGLTLVMTTGNGLPNLSDTYTTPPALAADCPRPNMDCAAEATVLHYFMDATNGGNNAKATQTSGLKASHDTQDLGIEGVRWLSLDTMAMQSASTLILGGGQFTTGFSSDPAKEGCRSKFPPSGYAKAGDVPVKYIPSECFSWDYLSGKLPKLPDAMLYKKVPAEDLISPEQAASNVLERFFDSTLAGLAFGGATGTAPLNYLQIYYGDIQYATSNTSNSATVEPSGLPTVSESAQDLLNQTSAQLTTISEVEPSCPAGTSCPR